MPKQGTASPEKILPKPNSLDAPTQLLNQPTQIIPIVLCAGFGTRLRPLTYAVPKVVAPMGRAGPIAWDAIRQLLEAGAPVVHVNTHYRAPFVHAELSAAAVAAGYAPTRIRYWHEPDILETGGAIARIVQELTAEDPAYACADALVLSGDIFGDVPLAQMCAAWSAYAADQSVGGLLMSRALDEERKDKTWVSADGNWVVGFGAVAPPDHSGAKARLFSNHQMISHRLLKFGSITKESSVTMYYRRAQTMGLKLVHVPLASNLRWFNVGTYPEFLQCLGSLAGKTASGDQSDLTLPPRAWTFGAQSRVTAALGLLPSQLQLAGQFKTWFLPAAHLADALSHWLREFLATPALPSSHLSCGNSAAALAATSTGISSAYAPAPLLAFLAPTLELDLPARALCASGSPTARGDSVSGEDPLLVPLELLLTLAPPGFFTDSNGNGNIIGNSNSGYESLFGPVSKCSFYNTSLSFVLIPWSRRLVLPA